MNKIIAATLLLRGCSSTSTNIDLGTHVDAGPDGLAGAAGAAGQAGSNNPPDGSAGQGTGGVQEGGNDAPSDAGPCGPLMILSGSVCVDKQPALLANGSQGPAVSWAEAVTICEGRGARLCTEGEREGACPGGQATFDGGNDTFCSGPMNTWEWSSSTSCADGRCKSPCCNSVTNPCHCSVPPTDALSFRCCRSL